MEHRRELFPLLETDRLVLRQIAQEDVDTLFTIFSDERVTAFHDLASFSSLDQVEQFVRLTHTHYEQGRGILWGITHRHDRQVIGICGYNNWIRYQHSRGEIVYDLGYDQWGQGIMTEALRGIIRYGFAHMALNRIEAFACIEDTRSLKLLHRLGFHEERVVHGYGPVRSRQHEQVSFSLLRREWLLRNGQQKNMPTRSDFRATE
jgi:ribosomal-protein-alanine N-acetyltransferase